MIIKSNIKTKILLIILSTAVASLLAFVIIALFNSSQLNKFFLESSEDLGNGAAENSETALTDQARYYLQRLAQNQAAISDALLRKVELKVNVVAWYAENLLNSPIHSSSSQNYFTDSNLKDPLLGSVCKIVEGAKKLEIDRDLSVFSDMDKIYKSIYPNDSNLKSIYLGTEAGLHKRYPWTSKKKEGYDPRKRGWYKEAAKKGKLGWTDLYISASDEVLMITCYKPVYKKDKELAGVIGADVTLTALNKGIINTQIGDLGHAFLIDKNGKLIASREMSKEGKKWDETLSTENLLKHKDPEVATLAQKMINGETGVDKVIYNGGLKYAAYAPIQSTNWSLCVVMPVSEIIAPAVETKNHIAVKTKQVRSYINTKVTGFYITLLVVFVIIIAAVTILAMKLSKSITAPILSLDDGAKRIGSGELDYKLEVNTGDELEELAETFNKMASDLVKHINNLQETTAAKEKIESELQIATDIQESFLPRIFPAFPERSEFDILATMEPAKEVGGDFYDFFLINDTKLFFVIGDVSGKGVPAALFMVVIKVLLKNEALRGNTPADVLSTVNDIIARDNESCMFATVFCGILDTETGHVDYANAGHNPPLIYKDGADFEYLEINKGFVLGPIEDMIFKNESLQLNPSDVLFLYTDGVNEAMDPVNNQYSEERLKTTLNKLKGADIEKIIGGIREDVSLFVKDAEPSDDITMLSLEYK